MKRDGAGAAKRVPTSAGARWGKRDFFGASPSDITNEEAIVIRMEEHGRDECL